MLTPLFSPKPLPGEGPLGLLQRATAGNHCRNTLQFLRGLRCGLDDASTALPTLGHQESLFESVCQQAGIETIGYRAYRKIGPSREGDLEWMGLRVPMSALPLKRWRFCPQCLASDGYTRALWDHRAVLACARHHSLLRSSCTDCGRITTYNDRIDRCRCGARFAAMPAPAIPDTDASLAADLVERRDQIQLDRLDAIYMQVSNWSRYGLDLTASHMLSSIVSLFNGHWPDCLTNTPASNPDALHPRVVLARLLNSKHAPVAQAAHSLLDITGKGQCFKGAIDADMRIAGDHGWKVLGIARAPFQKLLEAGLLHSKGKMFAVHQINRLLVSAMGSNDQHIDGISIQSLRSARYRMSLATVISRIQRGDSISLGFNPDAGLSGLSIDKPLTQMPHTPSAYYRVKDLMDLLNVNEAAVRFLIAQQWLKATRIQSDGGYCYGIHHDDAHDFHRNYCFSVNLPCTAHDSRRKSLKSAIRAGLVPVSGPHIDGAPTYLFRRSGIKMGAGISPLADL